MPRRPMLPVPMLLVALSLLGAHFLPWDDQPEPQSRPALKAADLPQNARAVLGIYCSGCHNQGRSKIDLDDSIDLNQHRDRAGWQKVVHLVRSGQMPPRGGLWPMPSSQERQTLIHWIEQEFLKEGGKSELASVRSRRLQRHEYVNVVRDLLGIAFHPGSDFPEDDPSWKRGLPELSPQLMAKYQTIAEQILYDLLIPETPLVLSPPSDDEEDDLDESCDASSGEERARDIIAPFAYRAFRRPLGKGELEDLMACYRRAAKSGLGFDDSLKAVLVSVLTAPQFLFRMEALASDTVAGSLDRERQFELAARLSFFLWSSTPDDELLAQADKGRLPQNLLEQARRMMHDPRARALEVDFANAWLDLTKINLDGDEIARAARQETRQFVATIVREDRSVLEFLDADYTYLNEPLARHYGISGINGTEMRRVSLSDKQRGGLITQAHVLMLMSIDNSPSKRGKWILENILGSPPLAPPSGLLQALTQTQKVFEPGTVRQLMAKHRNNQSCAACHEKMDALGIALENFDASGLWRTKEINGRPIDALGELPGGETINGLGQLKAYLIRNKDLFVRSLGRKLLSYSLGRKLDKAHLAALDSFDSTAARNQYRFSSVLWAVIESGPFQNGWAKD